MPGKYSIRVFHNGAWLKDQKFEIASERGDVPVEVKLEAPGAAGAGAKPTQPETDKGAEPARPQADRETQNKPTNR
jgi:hypothetical protein